MNNTKIEWTDHTFNPWWGCMKVSAGCKNCYAEKLDNRWQGGHWGPGSARRAMSESYWQQPWKWNKAAAKAGKPAKVFCSSMADVFEGHPDTLPHLQRLFKIIERTPHLIWQLLTKRPENIMDLIPRYWLSHYGMPDNLWIGTSVENQEAADQRIPHLLKVPAKVRFLSCEPLIGSVDLSNWIGPIHIDDLASRCGFFDGTSPENNGYGCNHHNQKEIENGHGKCFDFSCPIASRLEPSEPLDQPIYNAFRLSGDEYNFLMKEEIEIHWVIAGGESGPGARPMHPDWVRGIRDQCIASGVPFFFKQWGEWKPFYDRDIEDPDWRRIPEETNKVQRINLAGGMEFHGERVIYTMKKGKKLAGRLLDAKEWNEFPGGKC